MSDNAPLPLATGSTRNAATDQVAYSGDVADVQLVRVVEVTGAEGSKTVVTPTFNVLQPDITASGTLAGAGQLVNIPLNGQSSASIQITGVWAGTISFEGTVGGVTFDPINGTASSTSTPASTTVVNGTYRITPGSLASIQARMSGFGSGSATVAIRASAGAGGTFANQVLPTKNTDGVSSQTIKAASTAAVAADQAAVIALHPSSPLPAGTNMIGSVAGAAGAALALDGTDITTPTAMPAGGVGIRGWLSAIWTKLNGTLGVTGAFFQATQPVSMATNTPDVTDRAGRLLGSIANTAFVANAGTNLNTSALSLDATLTNHTMRFQAVTTLTTLSAANTAVTLTLPAVAAQFHYIARVRITLHNTSAAAVAGSAVALGFTSTNIPGALAWTDGNALAAGSSKTVVDEVLENSIRSSAVNTATTITAPAAGLGVQTRITVYYYTAT